MLKTGLHYCNIFGMLWTLCLCMFQIAMPRWLEFTSLYILVITWAVEFIIDKRWQVKPSREWIFYGLLVVFFLWAFLYFPWDGNVYFHRFVEQRLPLLGFGIAGLFGLNNRYSRATLINTMIIASVCSVLFLKPHADVYHSPIKMGTIITSQGAFPLLWFLTTSLNLRDS